MPNVFRPELQPGREGPPGFQASRDRIAARAGSSRLGASVYRLPPGESVCPYHWEGDEEEMLIVLAGTPSVRTPQGWRAVRPGDVVSFAPGEAGAHQVANFSEADADVLLVSEMSHASIAVYPDSDKVGVFGPVDALFRRGDAVDYFDGESAPDTMPPA
jgi:uncharacterized cupin superfamily protein